MKDRSINALYSLADITVELCGYLTKKRFLEKTDAEKRSEDLKNEIFRLVIKQFITPVEKEDIAYIAAKLHLFNLHLCRLLYKRIPFSFEYADEETAKAVYTMCVNTRSIIKKGFSVNNDCIFAPIPPMPRFLSKNTYNPSATLWEYATFTALDDIFTRAEAIFDSAVVAAIKNS